MSTPRQRETVDSKRVLVTGGTGLVGRAVVQAFLAEGHQVTVVARSEANFPEYGTDRVQFKSLDLVNADEDAIREVTMDHQVVVHLMALTHQPDVKDDASYRRVNVEPTQRLLKAALSAGVETFIYMSSIKAVAESSKEPLTEQDEPRPQDAYGRSKLAAEQLVQSELQDSKLAWFILRPPLVYGLGVQGNLQRVVRWLDQGRPVPCIRPGNARTMVSDRNLASLVCTAATAPKSLSGIYHAADAESWSFEEMANALSAARGVPLRRLVVPQRLFAALPKRIREHPSVSRLTGSLPVSSEHARVILGWIPVESGAEGLIRAFSKAEHQLAEEFL